MLNKEKMQQLINGHTRKEAEDLSCILSFYADKDFRPDICLDYLRNRWHDQMLDAHFDDRNAKCTPAEMALCVAVSHLLKASRDGDLHETICNMVRHAGRWPEHAARQSVKDRTAAAQQPSSPSAQPSSPSSPSSATLSPASDIQGQLEDLVSRFNKAVHETIVKSDRMVVCRINAISDLYDKVGGAVTHIPQVQIHLDFIE